MASSIAGTAQRSFYTAIWSRHISFLVPPDRQNEMPAILDSIRRGQRIAHYETVRIAKDRRRLDVFLSVSPVHEEGRIVGAASIARDNTEHKRLEERSRLYTKGLELIHEMDRKILQHASGRECAQFVIRHLVAMAHLSRVTITSLRIGKAEQG